MALGRQLPNLHWDVTNQQSLEPAGDFHRYTFMGMPQSLDATNFSKDSQFGFFLKVTV
jgi:hypothetical protein